MRPRYAWLWPLFVLCALIAAGCGGQNSSSAYVPIRSPGQIVSSPQIVSQGSFYESQVFPLNSPSPGATSIAFTLPTANVTGGSSGGSGVFPIPSSMPTNLDLTEIISSGPIVTNVPTLQSTQRAQRTVQALRAALAASGISPFLYGEIVANYLVSFPNSPSFTLTVPAADILPNTSYYLAQYDILRPSLGWQLGFEGPGTVVSATSLAFAAPSPAIPITLQPNIPLYFALYSVSSSVPSPSPAPTISALPPLPPFTLSPTGLTVAAGGTGIVTIADPTGYTGGYAVNSSASGIANASVSGTTVTVSGLVPGTAWITVSAANSTTQSRTASFFVTVTGSASGTIVIDIPSPSPIVCSPAAVTVPVGQVAIADCTAAGWGGGFTATVADPSIATATLATGTNTYYYIRGLAAGSTTLDLQYQPGLAAASVSLPITVPPQ